jgi:hypothetical protein
VGEPESGEGLDSDAGVGLGVGWATAAGSGAHPATMIATAANVNSLGFTAISKTHTG